MLAAVRDIVAAAPRFNVSFSRVNWFGDAVLWLAPRPAEPFRDLTTAIWQRFPEAPPYAGDHSEIVPHLTVGHGASRTELEQAAAGVAARLPIEASAELVRLIVGVPDQGPWHTLREFPLGELDPGQSGG